MRLHRKLYFVIMPACATPGVTSTTLCRLGLFLIISGGKKANITEAHCFHQRKQLDILSGNYGKRSHYYEIRISEIWDQDVLIMRKDLVIMRSGLGFHTLATGQ